MDIPRSLKWVNVHIVRKTGDGFICKCHACGHEYYSNSNAALREAEQTGFA